MQQFLFSYDDICLKPRHSSLPSRSKADTSIEFLGFKFRLPIVPANMTDVISWDIADGLQLNDYFYIMHRFNDANLKIPPKAREKMDTKFVSVSIGVNSEAKYALERLGVTPDFITIDVAHGHHSLVKDMMKFIENAYFCHRPEKKPKLIVGNVATADGYKYLCDLGANAVKVGIGGGSICTTRYKTGFHIPTAYAVWDCAQVKRDVPIIADGGAKHFGDVAKALVLGADMVMSGRWFAECIDSPAKVEHGKKVYRGSTSFEAKGVNNHIEGQTLTMEHGCTYSERLEELRQALQSSISYGGGKDLSCFNSVTWQLIKTI